MIHNNQISTYSRKLELKCMQETKEAVKKANRPFTAEDNFLIMIRSY